jgi:hypothetical protein
LSLEALFGVENQAQASKTPFIFANIPQEQQFALATPDKRAQTNVLVTSYKQPVALATRDLMPFGKAVG